MESRVVTLEANHQELTRNINEIKNNHLAHLSADVSNLDEKVDKLSLTIAKWGGIVIGALAVVEVILKFVLK